MNPTHAEVEMAVLGIVRDTLPCDPQKVLPSASLMDDLGAESLDLLDVVFALEQRFAIQLTRGAMERAARGDMDEAEFAPGGVVSPAGLLRLRQLLPESAERIKDGLRAVEIMRLFTPQTFANLIIAQVSAEGGPR